MSIWEEDAVLDETHYVVEFECPRCKEVWWDHWLHNGNDDCPGCGLRDIESTKVWEEEE